MKQIFFQIKNGSIFIKKKSRTKSLGTIRNTHDFTSLIEHYL